jgi:hypothetical protein
MKSTVEIEYERYASLLTFTGKPVPLYEEYLVQKGLPLDKYLTPDELDDANRLLYQ